MVVIIVLEQGQDTASVVRSRFNGLTGQVDTRSVMGGAPFDRASAEVGKTVADYRTRRIGDAIKLLAENTQPHN